MGHPRTAQYKDRRTVEQRPGGQRIQLERADRQHRRTKLRRERDQQQYNLRTGGPC